MTKKEIIERNISLTFDFVHHLIENNAEIDKLPENFDVEFVDKDFPQIEMKSNMESDKTGVAIPKQIVPVKRTFSVSNA